MKLTKQGYTVRWNQESILNVTAMSIVSYQISIINTVMVVYNLYYVTNMGYIEQEERITLLER